MLAKKALLASLCLSTLFAATLFSSTVAKAEGAESADAPVSLSLYYNPFNFGMKGFSGSWNAVASKDGLIMKGETNVVIIPVSREAHQALGKLKRDEKHDCELTGTLNKGESFMEFFAIDVDCR